MKNAGPLVADVSAPEKETENRLRHSRKQLNFILNAGCLVPIAQERKLCPAVARFGRGATDELRGELRGGSLSRRSAATFGAAGHR